MQNMYLRTADAHDELSFFKSEIFVIEKSYLKKPKSKQDLQPSLLLKIVTGDKELYNCSFSVLWVYQ